MTHPPLRLSLQTGFIKTLNTTAEREREAYKECVLLFWSSAIRLKYSVLERLDGKCKQIPFSCDGTAGHVTLGASHANAEFSKTGPAGLCYSCNAILKEQCYSKFS